MGVLLNHVRDVSSSLLRRSAPDQAGILAGAKPNHYDPNDPIKLWVIQFIIIVGFTQILALIGSRIRQPRVIAEVIGGVLLGPTVMGRIPGFTAAVFPTESIPLLNLTANIGLVLFLFLVGLEVDIRLIKRNAKASAVISAAGLALPLGLGAALGVPLYHEFIDPSVNFGYFVLFTAVAIGITAFPVLCRILTETRLLESDVGVVVLSAGVGNDVVGWILLALTVALVNAGNGLTALYVLLTAVGFVIFLLYPVRWGYRWVARRSGSLENGRPTTLMMTLTVALVFSSAFFTDIIGVHAIFGGFLAGLLIPKENGFAISIVEKLEDLVAIIFLPLYFALSGLKTNLGLLDNGVTWGYTILIIVIAFFSKFLGCSIAAKLFGFDYRQSGAIGVLMSCKGLVELIVLNVGLQAGVLDTRTFSMFVLHALVVTFLTTPLTLWIYPPQHRKPAPTNKSRRVEEGHGGSTGPSDDLFKSRFTVVLNKIEQLPAMMALTQLLQSSAPAGPPTPSSSGHEKNGSHLEPIQSLQSGPDNKIASRSQLISIDAVRLIELTERTSDLFKSQEVDTLVHSDPVLSVVRAFGYLNHLCVSTSLRLISYEDSPSFVANHARDTSSQLVILPWSSRSSFDENITSSSSAATSSPFDGLFNSKQSTGREQTAAIVHTQFIRKVFTDTPADVALYVDRGLPDRYDGQFQQHIFLPFFGGPDDRLALSFVVQLCMNSSVSATVVRFTKVDTEGLTPYSTVEHEKTVASATNVFPDTVYGARDTQTRLASDTADNILWERFTRQVDPEFAEAVSRITFFHHASSQPVHAVLESVSTTITQHSQARLLVVVGRSRRMAVETHSAELRALFAERNVVASAEVAKTLGDIGAAFTLTNANTSLLVLQAHFSS